MALTLGVLSFTSLALTLWQWFEGRLFRFNTQPNGQGARPAVTVLKPLKGVDSYTEECLRTWFEQDYSGEVQLLFGVQSPDDPVTDAVRKLMATFPDANAELVVCKDRLGVNAKVSTLIQLERSARHDVLVISDADVAAPPDLLTELANSIMNPSVGLANPFYRISGSRGFALRWEALSVNSDFWTSVLQSRRIEPTRFALGAVVCVRRCDLQRIGGFTVLSDYLADDFELGRRIAEKVGPVHFLPIVVECRHDNSGFRRVWNRQLRWARTIRACRPFGFALSILNNTTIWPLAYCLAVPSRFSAAVAALCMVVRATTAFDNERRIMGTTGNLMWFWMPWIKDILSALLWILAFTGNTVEWRGERYRIRSDGKIEKIELG